MDKSERDEIRNLIDFGGKEKSEKEPLKQDVDGETKKIELPAPNVGGSPDVDTEPAIENETDESDFDEAPVTVNEIEAESDIDSNDIDDYGNESDIPLDTDAPKVFDNIPDGEDIADSTADEPPHDDDFDFGYGFEEEKKSKKPISKTARLVRNIIIAVMVVAFIIMFAVTDTGIIGAYKRNFKHNFSRIFGITEKSAVTETVPEPNVGTEPNADSESNADSEPNAGTEPARTKSKSEANTMEIVNMAVKTSAIIPYEYASESDYSAYGDGIICASTNYMRYINGSGEIEWECATSVIDPILRTAGNYILIAQEGGTKLCLYEGSKLIYDTDCDDNILSANLSQKGDCVLVTTKDLYKGAIAAYNKSGNLIFARSSGGGSVIDAAISPSSRNIAVSLLDTEDMVRSTVEIFDITKNDPVSSVVFDDTILFDVEYFKNTINAIGDNSSIGIKSNGEVIYDMRFDGSDLNHYAFDSRGNKLLLLSASNIPTFKVCNAKGRETASRAVLEMADYLCIGNGRMMYNNDREILMGKINGKTYSRYTASMDIRRLIMVNKNTFFIVYSNSVELVKV